MILKSIIYEDFVQYRKPSLFLGFPSCTWKCEKEYGDGTCRFCQNSSLEKGRNIKIEVDSLIKKYLRNSITSAIVFGGLEPIDSMEDVIEFVDSLRNNYFCNDTVVIYSGYKEDEIKKQLLELSKFNNIIVKFGRYIPDDEKIYDDVLGVILASRNQYAKIIS